MITTAQRIETAMEKYNAWLKTAGLETKPHQLQAMRWALKHELISSDGINGGLIADEMGLGKTIILLGLMISNFRGSTLIVVPRPILEQWKRIIERYFGHDAIIYHGSALKGSRKLLKSATSSPQSNAPPPPSPPPPPPIVLTTYGIMQTRKPGCPLYDVKWTRLVCDEAHHLRNRGKLYQNMLRLKAEIKWMVTGTPLQNRKTDLQVLCTMLGLAPAFLADPDQVKTIILRHSLRRTKKQVGIKLPPKSASVITVPWLSAEEEEFCKQIHAQVTFPRVTLQNVNRIMAFLGNSTLAWFTRLRQVSVLPHLLQPKVNALIDDGIIDEDMSLSKIKTTSKLTAVAKFLKKRHNNHRRKLVFCHYHGEIDLLEAMLKKCGITTVIIDGRARAAEKRFATLAVPSEDEFRSVSHKWKNIPTEIYGHIAEYMAPEVAIVQIQSTSEGLNLQHFQEIYFTSPWWNPALEDQAVARAHRIGQNQKVEVFRFVMENFGGKSVTLDQYCMIVQQKKRELMKFFK